MAEPLSLLKRIDLALGRYYEQHQVDDYFDFDGNGKFLLWCEENGYDSDGIEDELGTDDPNDCVLCDFDEHGFPIPARSSFKPQISKFEAIYTVLKTCYEDPSGAYTLDPDDYFPELDSNFFNVTESDIEETINIYSQQCAAIFDVGMVNDKTIIEMLAIGHKNGGIQYLQHLADMFCRDRIKYHHQTQNIKCRALDVIQWSGKDSKHFDSIRCVAPNKADIVKSSVNSYFKRICPKLLLSETWRIRDSCQESTNYVCSAILWVYKLATSRKQCCPFQIDFVIGYKKAKWDQILDPEQMQKTMEELYDEKEKYDDINNNSDDEEERYKDPSVTYFDCMGDVKTKLKVTGLKHVISKIHNINEDAADRSARIFETTFKKFENVIKGNAFPQYRRFISFLDRRKEEDEMIMYEPPDHCKFIPHNYVPLWFLGSSRSCLIPNLKYDGDEHDAANAVHLTVVDKQREIDKQPLAEYQYKLVKLIKKTKVENGMNFELVVKISLERYAKIWVHRRDEPVKYTLIKGPIPTHFLMKDEDTIGRRYRTLKDRLQNTNVTTGDHVKGGMLVLSFHVIAVDQIKAYFFYCGQISRFVPYDIVQVFPKFFDQTWDHGANRKWWKSGKAEAYYEKIKDKLPDVKFEAFCKEYKTFYHPQHRDQKEEQEERERQKNMLLFG